VDYIVKPLMPEILKSKISVFVDLYRNNAMLSQQIKERPHRRGAPAGLTAESARPRSSPSVGARGGMDAHRPGDPRPVGSGA